MALIFRSWTKTMLLFGTCKQTAVLIILKSKQNETRHEKTNKVSVRPAKTLIRLGGSESWLSIWRNLGSLLIVMPRLIRVLVVHMKKPWVLSYPLSRQWRLWSDWANAQADQSLCLMHTHFVGFVMSQLKCSFTIQLMCPKDVDRITL